MRAVNVASCPSRAAGEHPSTDPGRTKEASANVRHGTRLGPGGKGATRGSGPRPPRGTRARVGSSSHPGGARALVRSGPYWNVTLTASVKCDVPAMESRCQAWKFQVLPGVMLTEIGCPLPWVPTTRSKPPGNWFVLLTGGR